MEYSTDYTKIAKDLIFRERLSLKEFTDGSALNAALVDKMMGIDVLAAHDFEHRALECMNTTYYLCTIIVLDATPEYRWGEYSKIAFGISRFATVVREFVNEQGKMQSQFGNSNIPKEGDERFQTVTLALTAVLLRHYDASWQVAHESFLQRLESFVEQADGAAYAELFGSTFTDDMVLPPNAFQTRKSWNLDFIPDIDVKDINWKENLMQSKNKEVALKSFTKLLNQPELAQQAGLDLNQKLSIMEDLAAQIKVEVLADDDSELEEWAELTGGGSGTPEEVRLRARLKELKQENDDLKWKNTQLSEQVDDYRAKSKGLSAWQAALFTKVLAEQLGLQVRQNRKRELGELALQLFGYSPASMGNKICSPCPEEDRNALAKLFDALSPALADLIRSSDGKKA